MNKNIKKHKVVVKPINITIVRNSNGLPISRKLKIFFIIIQATLSFDFGFINYKSLRQKLFIKTLTVIISTIIGVTIIIKITNGIIGSSNMWYLKYVIGNYSYVIILIFIPQYKTFYQFLRRLNRIDYQMYTKTSYHVEVKILATCVVSMTCKILISFLHCLQYEACRSNILYQFLFTVPFLAIDIPLIVMYFVFYASCLRIIELQNFLKEKNLLIASQKIYKELSDATESTKKTFSPIFLVTLSINIPGLMAEIYYVIEMIKVQQKRPQDYMTEIISAITLCIVFFAPAISASTLSNEVNNVKLILHNMIIQENDISRQNDIQRFINYIEARPFKYKVLRVIDLDATLPTSLFSVFITYLIVMLQLAHLY